MLHGAVPLITKRKRVTSKDKVIKVIIDYANYIRVPVEVAIVF